MQRLGSGRADVVDAAVTETADGGALVGGDCPPGASEERKHTRLCIIIGICAECNRNTLFKEGLYWPFNDYKHISGALI